MKRCLFTIILFLLLGAIVNVAVAWGIAAVHRWPSAHHSLIQKQNETTSWSIQQFHDPYVTYVSIITKSRTPGLRANVGKVDSPEQLIPKWVYVQWRDHHKRDSRVRWLSVGFGWPYRSVCWHTPDWLSRDPGPPLRGGIETGLPAVRSGRPFTIPRALPVLPIWPGFLINTFLYATILWLLIPGPFVLRRLIRIKRGRCPKCGYDLRGELQAGCPECGWGRGESSAAHKKTV